MGDARTQRHSATARRDVRRQILYARSSCNVGRHHRRPSAHSRSARQRPAYLARGRHGRGGPCMGQGTKRSSALQLWCDSPRPRLTPLLPRRWPHATSATPLASRHCSTATYATSAAGNPSDSATYSRILEILDSKAKIPYIGRVLNGLYYNFWQDETHVRGIWRRCTLDEYRKESLPPPAVGARLGEPLHRVELRTGGARLGDGARPGCPRCGGGRLVGVGRLHPARRGAHRPQGAGDDSPLAGRLRRHRGARDVCSRYREGARR